MADVTHFIGGKRVSGTSGRFADIFDPNTGEVQARAPLASTDEVRAAIANAAEAQPGWAAQNPQKRARVMMRFVDLLNREMDSLARLLSSEHGKTIPDARGDIQRGLEVCEFAIGIPHLIKGEYSEGAGTGIDVYSMRQPLGVVTGITPFNFPAMVPMWMFRGGARLRQHIRAEADPSAIRAVSAVAWRRCCSEAGLPDGVFNVVQRRQVRRRRAARSDRTDAWRSASSGRRAIAEYVYRRGRTKARQARARPWAGRRTI